MRVDDLDNIVVWAKCISECESQVVRLHSKKNIKVLFNGRLGAISAAFTVWI
jgi:hypothetical protein